MALDAPTPDQTPAVAEQTYDKVAVSVSIDSGLDKTVGTIAWRKFGLNEGGFPVYSPNGPFQIVIPDMDAYVAEQIGAGDARWAQCAQLLWTLCLERIAAQEAG